MFRPVYRRRAGYSFRAGLPAPHWFKASVSVYRRRIGLKLLCWFTAGTLA
jgi:hypothetical protein